MNKEQLQDIFRQPYNAKTWQELLINLFGASEIRQTPSTLTSDSNEKVEGFQLGSLTTTDRYEIGLFAFEIKGGMNLKLNRVGLRSLVKSYTRLQVDAAIVVFYDSTHWRLSFICDIPKEGEKTDPKRYTPIPSSYKRIIVLNLVIIIGLLDISANFIDFYCPLNLIKYHILKPSY